MNRFVAVFYLYEGDNCEIESKTLKTVKNVISTSSIIAIIIIILFYSIFIISDLFDFYVKRQNQKIHLNKWNSIVHDIEFFH